MHDSDAFVSLGSNIGDRLSHLQWAISEFSAHSDLSGIYVSSVYETEAHILPGMNPQEPYMNAVAGLRTGLHPENLLSVCLSLESRRGRIRETDKSWLPRVLDLDVLAFGQSIVTKAELQIPHPRLGQRRFVLEPWAEIAPHFRVPAPFGKTVSELLADCEDALLVIRTPHNLLD